MALWRSILSVIVNAAPSLWDPTILAKSLGIAVGLMIGVPLFFVICRCCCHKICHQNGRGHRKGHYRRIVDLHGMSKNMAIGKVRKTLRNLCPGSSVSIITGRGLHSKGRKPIIKPAIDKLLKRGNYKRNWTCKGGMVTVDP